MSEPRQQLSPLVRFVILAAMSVAVFFMVATTSADVDLWGHVRFGLDMLEQGRIESHDPYSFTSDRTWINHEWLSELVFALAWRAGRSSGLIAVKLVVTAITLLVLWRTLVLRGVGPEARLVLTGLALAGMLPRLVHVRPQLFSVVLFSILMWVAARAEHGRRGTLAICPPLLMLWTNFHGGWITGLGALGLWALGDAWDRRSKGLHALDGLAWTGASAAATLVNPYGIGLWRFLAATVRFGREGIGEWGPIWSEQTALVVWILLVLVVVAAVRSTGVRELGTRLLQPVFWGLASLRVVRLDAFFALSVAAFLGPAFERFLGRRRRPAGVVPLPLRAGIVAGLLAIALAIPRARETFSCIAMYPASWPEPAAIEFIHANALSGRMLTFFNWGEYGIWHLPRTVLVSMDGRRETVYSDEMFTMHLRFYRGEDAGVAYVEALGPDYAWLPVGMPGASALRTRGWHPVYEGEHTVILAAPGRAGGPYSEPASSRTGVRRCFPGP